MKTLDYSNLETREIPVTLPDGSQWILREASGKVATRHRNAIMASTQFGPDGRILSVSELASIEASFVAGCMWSANADDPKHKSHNPPVQLVENLHSRVQKELYDESQQLSRLNEEVGLVKELKKALAAPGSPCTFDELTQFLSSPVFKDVKAIQKFLDSDEDREVKN